MNEEIKVPKVRLIDAEGQQVGIVSVNDAIKKAREAEMDVVEIAPQAKPPVCKLIDYGKFLYEQQKKEKIQKKKQHVTILKEIRLHPNTDTHDVDFKCRHAENFLNDGNKVKVAVIFKGRELAYKEQGEVLLQKFIDRLEEEARVEQEIKFEGRTMFTILAPKKSKKNK
ncbi:MAG: translation initiation factor IF-3 [Melioribacteraceae bacterium]|nr:translation initiation factor IF-3 [Melioribacteraceae bacterium]MCF8354381.1 translation initiation factor IF-3 [Melioribacteraceae bacterium]MCF8396219.1 translation initiation factor IF-3 [Melioribacteraceae bacterium]MCF8417235.1 translation initiation factor IF-3 [Melioribacteraceae bacterium]